MTTTTSRAETVSFEKKLASYALTGGVALLASASTAEAGIITITPGVTPGAPGTAPTISVASGDGAQSYQLDIDLDGTPDLVFNALSVIINGFQTDLVSVRGVHLYVESITGFGPYAPYYFATRYTDSASALAANPTLSKAKLLARYTNSDGSKFYGDWPNHGNGLLSVLFNLGGATPTHGFVDVQVDLGSSSFTINQYGYQVADTPEPSSMALFALGAAGIAALRRRKQQTQ